MKTFSLVIVLLAVACLLGSAQAQTASLSLNGTWDMGLNRQYQGTVQVPGIHQDPKAITPGRLWYRRQVTLPPGKYAAATLRLNGARFRPALYVNGKLVDSAEGGMAPIDFHLTKTKLKGGRRLTIEVALQPLSAVPTTDASAIPDADRWRSNISSSLWDEVSLRLHGAHFLTRVVPISDVLRHQVTAQVYLSQVPNAKPLPLGSQVQVELQDQRGQTLVEGFGLIAGQQVAVTLGTKSLQYWSPENPVSYRLVTRLLDDKNKVLDEVRQSWGLKEFRTKGKGLVLNYQPFTFRAGTVVWHRWVRDPEATALGYDTTWFLNNVIKPLKDRGANGLRFHLGTPPEALLRLCDRHGLAVQYEWLFFHGLNASRESLLHQWRQWLDLAQRHPSVCIIHPWNETDPGPQLDGANAALDSLLPEYGPLVLADRQTLHLHKYWWSLFENLGLYYNNAKDFPTAVISDEFGGNYLDGNAEPGGYKTLSESLLRWLGPGHTAQQRLQHHTLSNARVAEYWRRLGVAGFSPFCIAGSWEDGNHWYLGPLKEGNLKPVWDALTAAWAPSTVSIELWDRNVAPGQYLRFPLWLINGRAQPDTLVARLQLLDTAGRTVYDTTLTSAVAPFGRNKLYPKVPIPNAVGTYTVRAELLAPKQPTVTRRIVSEWQVRATAVQVPANLQRLTVALDPQESELLLLAHHHNWTVVHLGSPQARLTLVGRRGYELLTAGDSTLRRILERALQAGQAVALLSTGPQWLGQAEKSHYQGSPKVTDARVEELPLFGGIKLTFTEAPEPESHIHPSAEGRGLLAPLLPWQLWLWNGTRGGLIVPAADMRITGLSRAGLANLWASRGANPDSLAHPYYAYELQGYYAFSTQPKDAAVQKALRQRVAFAVEDGVALKTSINVHAPIIQHDLHQLWQEAATAQARDMAPLVVAGKNLVRTPAIRLGYGDKGGQLLLSQLMMNGRLVPGYTDGRLYGQRYDPAAHQLLLNMLGAMVK